MEGQHQQRDEGADDERGERIGGEAQPDDDDDRRGHDQQGPPEAVLHAATLATPRAVHGANSRGSRESSGGTTRAVQPMRGPAARTASETPSAYWLKFSANMRDSSAALRS